MANKYTDAAHNITGLKPTTKAVLLVLAYHADNTTGECWPSIMTIASKAGLSTKSRRAVKDALEKLNKLKIVSTVGSKPTKFGAVNVYKISSEILKPSFVVAQLSKSPVPSASKPRLSENGTPALREPQNSSQELVNKNSSFGNRAVIDTSKTEDTDQSQTPSPAKFGLTHCTPLTIVAMTEHLHSVAGMPEIRPTDPLLPLLVRLAEEQLAHDLTRTMEIPPPGWDEERDGFDCFMEVPPGDPHHPGTDKSWMPGGFTLRELAVMTTWSKFHFAINILLGLAQYLDLSSEEELPEGMVQFSETDIITIMRGLGWPEGGLTGGVFDCSLNEIWAIAHWAFSVERLLALRSNP